MSRRLGLAVALAVAAVAVIGCVGQGPYDASAVFRPSSMVADRDAVRGGDAIELTFPDGSLRGARFVLEEEVGSTWIYRYQVTSTVMSNRSEWAEAGDDSLVGPGGEFFGPGPDRLIIPEVATPGSWRICTTGGEQTVCVRIEITEG